MNEQASEEPNANDPQDDAADENRGLHAEELADYVTFLRGVPIDNAIARRFIGAAHLLARAILVEIVFKTNRGLGFKWDEAAEMTGEMLSMSRSSVVRTLRDVNDVVEFWNANGYSFVNIEGLVEQMSALSMDRLGQAFKDKANDQRAKGEG